ncbi:MAG: DUF1667 domain-containing protein [Firmicutes bacterium]|nr:DUF1667 domain-containing protein [Bacillota bacterium]
MAWRGRRTAAAVPKARIPDCMAAIDRLAVLPPISVGDVIAPDLASTGVALIATWCYLDVRD